MMRPGYPVLLTIAALGFSCAIQEPAGAADDSIGLASHRAVYDLKLASVRGKRPVASVRGRILYDFTGNECEGYALQFRQVSDIAMDEGRTMVSDLRATTWEDGAAKSFRFNSQNYVDEKLVDDVDGMAERTSADTKVNLTKPAEKKFDLNRDVIFPTEHLKRIISAARAGKSILDIPVYDGSETGERIYQTLTVIGREIDPATHKPDDVAASEPALANLKRWPVNVSYFEKGKVTSGEQTPAYAIGFELYENGISRALKLDYNDFVVSGELTRLEVKTSRACK
jgi:hypothetical protein